MNADVNVHALAARPRQTFTANLIVSVDYTVLSRDAEGNAQLREVPEWDALQHMPDSFSSLKDLAPYTSRFENYALEWHDQRGWQGDEDLLHVLTQMKDWDDMHPDTLVRIMKGGMADFAPAVSRERQVRLTLLERIAARAYILEQAGHRVQVYKQARIRIEPDRVRVKGMDFSLDPEPLYVTGEQGVLPMPRTLPQAQGLLREWAL